MTRLWVFLRLVCLICAFLGLVIFLKFHWEATSITELESYASQRSKHAFSTRIFSTPNPLMKSSVSNLLFSDFKIKFVLEPEKKCESPGKSSQNRLVPTIWIFVTSSPEDGQLRNLIRTTWASNQSNELRYIFVLGQAKSERQQEDIENEAKGTGDILQYRMDDSYWNLSWKTFAILLWVSQNCGKDVFVVKTDSDVLVLRNGLLSLAQSVQNHTNMIFGTVWRMGTKIDTEKDGPPPRRDRTSKWYVRATTYNKSRYPIYTSGTGYLMTPDVPKKLISAVLEHNMSYFYLEDVMFTGIAAEFAGVQRVDKWGFLASWKAACEPGSVTVHLSGSSSASAETSLKMLECMCLRQSKCSSGNTFTFIVPHVMLYLTMIAFLIRNR